MNDEDNINSLLRKMVDLEYSKYMESIKKGEITLEDIKEKIFNLETQLSNRNVDILSDGHSSTPIKIIHDSNTSTRRRTSSNISDSSIGKTITNPLTIRRASSDQDTGSTISSISPPVTSYSANVTPRDVSIPSSSRQPSSRLSTNSVDNINNNINNNMINNMKISAYRSDSDESITQNRPVSNLGVGGLTHTGSISYIASPKGKFGSPEGSSFIRRRPSHRLPPSMLHDSSTSSSLSSSSMIKNGNLSNQRGGLYAMDASMTSVSSSPSNGSIDSGFDPLATTVNNTTLASSSSTTTQTPIPPLECSVIEADFSGLVDDYSSAISSTLPPILSWSFPKHKSALSVQGIANFCFPSGVSLQFLHHERALSFIHADTDERHILQFTDANGYATYSCVVIAHIALQSPSIDITRALTEVSRRTIAANKLKSHLCHLMTIKRRERWNNSSIHFSMNNNNNNNGNNMSSTNSVGDTPSHSNSGGSNHQHRGFLSRMLSLGSSKPPPTPHNLSYPAQTPSRQSIRPQSPSGKRSMNISTHSMGSDDGSNTTGTANTSNTTNTTNGHLIRSNSIGNNNISSKSNSSSISSQVAATPNRSIASYMGFGSTTKLHNNQNNSNSTHSVDQIGGRKSRSASNSSNTTTNTNANVNLSIDTNTNTYTSMSSSSTTDATSVLLSSDNTISSPSSETVDIFSEQYDNSRLNRHRNGNREIDEDTVMKNHSDHVIITRRAYCIITRQPLHAKVFHILQAMADSERSASLEIINKSNQNVSESYQKSLDKRRKTFLETVSSHITTIHSSYHRDIAMNTKHIRNRAVSVTSPNTITNLSNSAGNMKNTTNRTLSDRIFVPGYVDLILYNEPNHYPKLKEWSVAVLLTYLTPAIIIKVMNLLLIEKSIVIYGKQGRPGVVTAVSLAVKGLISPFAWEGVFVPLVPDDVRELFDAPVPFIAGTITQPRMTEVIATAAVLVLDESIPSTSTSSITASPSRQSIYNSSTSSPRQRRSYNQRRITTNSTTNIISNSVDNSITSETDAGVEYIAWFLHLPELSTDMPLLEGFEQKLSMLRAQLLQSMKQSMRQSIQQAIQSNRKSTSNILKSPVLSNNTNSTKKTQSGVVLLIVFDAVVVHSDSRYILYIEDVTGR